MIFCQNKVYAKVWKVEKNEKYIDLQITTSEKDQTGEYKNSRWFPRAIGHAFHTLSDAKEGDRITIEKCKFTNESYKAKDGTTKSAFKMLIMEATIDGAKPANVEPQSSTDAEKDKNPW